MRFSVDVIFTGFSGKLEDLALGWGTVALIKNEDKLILFDTGGANLRNYLPKKFEERGVKFSDIDYVFLSHLHFDHAYNIDLFRNSKIFLSKEEWEYANNLESRDLYIDQNAITFLKYADITFVKNNEIIMPNIKTILTPGHTPGCVSYLLKQDNGEVWGLVGDSVKNRGELINEQVQMTLDFNKTVSSIKKIKSTCDRILPGHDTWLLIDNGKVSPLKKNSKKLLYGQGVTVNNGFTEIEITLD
ncbi:MBL fold metallo-hydrolase [Peptoniphilus sp. AGMB00490]|uniref:MBL fold metallo-hydrolase n=1 Tax=Peptoniphilus faecalis TaxID=2731255 RepID=A0A848R9D6_9FIRM|nr:MBL fold metallo-hydrolase [Peptoniphilus faecalis]NMW84428.1 MBL fold metallo-hydrolase [Peptoniphilus faecalis]